MMPRLVVYTAVTGDYDRLHTVPASPEIRWVAFVDEESRPRTADTGWELRAACTEFDDPNRNAKLHKALPHLELPDEDLTMWIDGSIRVVDAAALTTLADVLGDGDLGVFEHRLRTCIYQEAAVCMERKLDRRDVIWRQMCRYAREGFEVNRGLSECSVILRRNTPQVRRFNEHWWREIQAGSRRDQLSFEYALHHSNVRRVALPGTIKANAFFLRVPHHAPARRILDVDRESVSSGAPVGRARHRHKKLAIGPMRAYPSWAWAGFDLGRELSKYYEVELFDSFAGQPRADVTLVIKQRPAAELLEKSQGPVVYCPIDAYTSEEQIRGDADVLSRCRALLVHSAPLADIAGRFAPTHRVEHHLRFALRELPPWKENGFVLWVGGFQHAPHLLRWLGAHPIAAELRLLSDIRCERAVGAAHAIAAGLGERPIELIETATGAELRGMLVEEFSESRQEQWMRQCRAALDIKGDDFNQATKPATKVQQFVGSGIPTAANPGSAPWDWFRRRGFDLASPLDADRWFSRAYYEETREVALELRQELSLEAVGKRYVQILESL